MCGICGEFRFDGENPDLGGVRSMLARLERRGPDDEGIYAHAPIALGHRRLAIIDLSARSHQPMVDIAAGLAVVFNGTIYNYRELRAKLLALGHRFSSDGDTEVILRAYAQWGDDCVHHLVGMFAIAIWDTRQETLFLARDRLGIKPLYYSAERERLRFASNTQALLAAGGIDTAIDTAALHHLFTLHAVVPAPRTILRGIRKLEPAHTLRIDRNGRMTKRCYWTLEAHRPAVPVAADEWQARIHAALKLAVKRRLTAADVPVGVLLSGGLDSSLLVALLAEQGVRDLKTFTVGFEDQPEEKGSEFEFSDPVAERYATEHHRFHVPNADVLRRLPEAFAQMAEPMFAQDAVAFFLLSEQVSRHVKVVQSGQGADEVFAGYFWYPEMHAATEATPLERFAPRYFDRNHAEFDAMVTPGFAGEDVTSSLIEGRLLAAKADTFIDSVLHLDVTTLIIDDPVKRVDNMTMAWGLEARVPFLDHELVELAASVPPELKLAEGGKGILKQIARPLLPATVIDRPKGYFPMPALKYVRGEFLDFTRDLLDSQRCRERGIYRRAYVDQLLAAPDQHHTPIRGNKLWHLAALELWLQLQGL
ncbi:MAG: N-acetylglutaminylglutamine amidotransferase [Thiotrichales bacterium]